MMIVNEPFSLYESFVFDVFGSSSELLPTYLQTKKDKCE